MVAMLDFRDGSQSQFNHCLHTTRDVLLKQILSISWHGRKREVENVSVNTGPVYRAHYHCKCFSPLRVLMLLIGHPFSVTDCIYILKGLGLCK